MQLYLRLPAVGVRKAFPNEDACRDRLINVRWPTGPECPLCSSHDIGFLKARRTYHCRACLQHFTAGSHTIFHRSRIGLVSWFATAEGIIADAADDGDVYRLNARKIQSRIATSYPAANRMVKIIRRDLSASDDSLIIGCICTQSESRPPHGIEENSRSHYTWLSAMLAENWRKDAWHH